MLTTAALLVAVGAVAAAALVGAVTRSIRAALPVLLDLLLAAGLLRLLAAETWLALASAAAVVAVRRLASIGIRLTTR